MIQPLQSEIQGLAKQPMKKMVLNKKSQSGSVILEALIAILIFSIGILAMVGMQAAAVNNVSEAKYRSDASFLANQIIGIMWANRVMSGVEWVADPAYTCNPCSAGGNANTLAWASSVGNTLPSGNSTIAVSGSEVTVTLSWKLPKEPLAAPAHTHTLITNIE